MRMHGHAAHDDMKYVPKEQVEEWRQQGPDRPPGARASRELGVDVDGAARRGPGARSTPATEEALRHADARPGHRHRRRLPRRRGRVLLGDGDAPWSGFAGGRLMADA